MIRKATPDDLVNLMVLCQNFHSTSPYSKLELSTTKLTKILNEILDSEDFCVIVYESDNKLNGMLIGTVTQLLFSEKYIASELAWWVQPEARKSGVGLELHLAFEQWAKEMADDAVSMVLLEDDNKELIDKMYTKLGYKPIERSYIKWLG